jgi:formate C-acetyltransferase
MHRPSGTSLLVRALLGAMSLSIRLSPRVRAHFLGVDGWMDFRVGIRTVDDSVRASIHFHDGRANVSPGVPDDADTVLCFRDAACLRRMLSATPEEVMNMLLRSELSTRGNLATLNKFNFFLSLLLKGRHDALRRRRAKARRAVDDRVRQAEKLRPAAVLQPRTAHDARSASERLSAAPCDAVRFLDDPCLSAWSLADFPRLAAFREIHFTRRPVLCAERARLVTEWCRGNGFETDGEGRPWVPELRQAQILRHVLEHKAARIRPNDLLPGTTTAEEIGVVLYPDTHGTTIWGELLSVAERELNPYDISDETRRLLHFDVFPYWEKRNVREDVRRNHGEPLGQRLDERFAVYFIWKTVAISHTIADFPRLLRLGTRGMADEIRAARDAADQADGDRRDLFEAMGIVLEGLETYAARLAGTASREAEVATDPVRRGELLRIAEICERVPREPARTLQEALTAIWLAWVALHMENTNAGLSLGRLDQWLHPYFEADLEAAGPEGRREAIARAIELTGCFFLRCTDHLPLVPDIGNFLFGGSSSDQAVTLGGVTPDGRDGVNDMTFVLLKVTEMLGLRDPNVNARYHQGINSETYLRRLCEVNLVTTATPSIHNDAAVMQALTEFSYPPEHLRDWAATGCVEPTLCGRHFGHTGNIMLNLVAALEMALNDGRHPLMDWKVGPSTGDPAGGAFPRFEDFEAAFQAQLGFLVDRMCEYNDMLGRAHARIRPTPLLSALIDGTLEKGRDVTRGGARYNTTGVACIGLTDVVDSLTAIRQLVYRDKRVTFAALAEALRTDFASEPALHALICTRVPKFGSGDEEALATANRMARFTHDLLASHRNHRDAPYTAGFWSMSNHVAFGCLSGALPSGRRKGKPFTPGLTPSAMASKHLLDPIRDVARLDPRSMTNNIAFNVKVVPRPGGGHAEAVDELLALAKTYIELGGMQMQFNVVGSDTLREAMAYPDRHRDLLVRISGYNAYFVTLNRDLQLELVERAEYRA